MAEEPQANVEENAAENLDNVENQPSTDSNDGKQERSSSENLKVLENIDVKLTVEVGNTELKIRDLLKLNEGSVVELDRLAGDPLDILANGTIIAKGEVVMVGERFGIRFTEVSDPEERVQSL
ncbi:MAG: flagellar motor switch protein FliN [Alphaproteobacteria bacterium TMED87]|nr:MAG: flagellar motor switch protein FliN [Alphaproteobacteria bacterium TMED87]|tara:strand:- start:495 stop:863 length:369 start_codon:yes stop_codon:yes gene_type:complete